MLWLASTQREPSCFPRRFARRDHAFSRSNNDTATNTQQLSITEPQTSMVLRFFALPIAVASKDDFWPIE